MMTTHWTMRRHARRLLVGACVGVLCAAASTRASAQQSASADLGFGMWRSPTSNTAASILGLSASSELPALRLDGSLALTTSSSRANGSPARLGILHLRAGSDTVTFRGLRGSLDVALDRDAFDTAFAQAQLAVVPSLAVGGRGVLAWVSVRPTRSLIQGATPTGVASEAGASLTRGNTSLSISVLRRRSQQLSTVRADSSGIIPSSCRAAGGGGTECMRRLASTGVAGHLSTTLREVELTVQGGVVTTTLLSASPAPVQRWATFRIGAPVRHNLMLVAQVGSEPPNVTRNLPMRRTVALGMRLRFPDRGERRAASSRTTAPPIELSAAEANGERTLRLHAPASVQQVELRGDLTSWKSVPLVRGSRGLWELRQRIEPGVHHLVVRYDAGPWQPVNGLPQVDDGFGEPTSVLIVGEERTGG